MLILGIITIIGFFMVGLFLGEYQEVSSVGAGTLIAIELVILKTMIDIRSHNKERRNTTKTNETIVVK